MGVTMGLKRTATLLTLAVAFVAMAVPAGAAPAEPTPNAYGLKYVGSAKCLSCHGSLTGRWQVGSYPKSSHGLNVKSVSDLGGVSGITPSASSTSYWPSPIFGTGKFRFAPADVWLQMGSPNSENRRFVSWFKNDGPHELSTGDTLPTIAGPADDLILFNARFYTDDPHWNPSAITSRLVFQNCGGCHFTGVTRPTDASYTLPSGAAVSNTTTSSMAAYGIQCESCHKSSDAGNHWAAGTQVTRTSQALKSQTCAQCHSAFSSNERNFTGGRFSNPTGFTTNKDLKAFGTLRGSQFVQQSAFVPAPTIPLTDTDFYPSGHRRFGGHGAPVYAEYQLSGHASSLRLPNGGLSIPFLKDECLPCHSGEAFLQSLGYGKQGPNDIGLHKSSVAKDKLNIECGVCHAVHAQGSTPIKLRLEGDELCTKCHQHGTAEVRSGRELAGVGDTGEWMPDASCSSCHMPSLDGMASHRMAILMPGDAEEWDVLEGEDSCSPCHAGSTRAKLQASIDVWQKNTTTRLSTAQSRLKSAKTRAAASTTAGKKLISSAEKNIKYIEMDGSLGVHNYPYVSAGLDKAAYYARAVGSRYSTFSSTRFDTRTRTAWVFGSLRYGDGATASAQRVTIQYRTAGSKTWRKVATVTSQDNGGISLRVKPRKTTYYRAVWTPTSGATFISASTKVRR